MSRPESILSALLLLTFAALPAAAQRPSVPMPDEPVPITPTRLPRRSTVLSRGQVEVKYASPLKLSTPSISGALGLDRAPIARTT